MTTNNDRDKLCRYINDPETIALADLFLTFLTADKTTNAYRTLRNAVILVSNFTAVIDAYSALAAFEERSVKDVMHDVTTLLINAAELFNKHYRGGKTSLDMPEFSDPNDALLFLGTTFMYVVQSEYSV